MAIDGNRSSFTSENNYTIDTFTEMFELSPTDAANVQRWKILKANSNRTEDEETEFINLTTVLAQKIVTSEDWNKLCDCMVNLQKMYVDKGLNEINSAIEDYVENYAQSDINDKLGMTVNELLLTNATQIIISTTTPTVQNGALWIKPRTTTA
jgi:hypothetical protein